MILTHKPCRRTDESDILTPLYAHAVCNDAPVCCSVHCPHSMRSRVYVSVRCPSVCLSHSSKPTTACLLLWARRAGDIDRLLHGRCSAAAAGEYGQYHVVSVRRKRNTDLLIYVTLLACCAFIKITLLLHNLFFYVVYLRHSTVTYKNVKRYHQFWPTRYFDIRTYTSEAVVDIYCDCLTFARDKQLLHLCSPTDLYDM